MCERISVIARCLDSSVEIHVPIRQVAELEDAAAHANQYKDEADELRHRAEKAAHLEKTVASMKQTVCAVMRLGGKVVTQLGPAHLHIYVC